jgi:hypothetical protein
VVVAPSGTVAKTEKGGQKRKGPGSGNNAPAI